MPENEATFISYHGNEPHFPEDNCFCITEVTWGEGKRANPTVCGRSGFPGNASPTDSH